MRTGLIVAVIAALIGASVVADAGGGKKAKHHHRHRTHHRARHKAKPHAKPAATTPDPAAGSGSAAGEGSGSGSAAGEGSGSGSAAGEGSGSASATPDTPAATATPETTAPAAAAPDETPAAADPAAAAPAEPASGAAPGDTPKTPRGHQFLDNMDCSACHTPDGWKLAATAGASGFDHDRTGFPLRATHAQTTCVGCHNGQRKTTPRECTGCHVDTHQGRNGPACAECHRATAWKDTAALDRHRLTRMPLTGAHALLDCTSCHRRTTERTWSDTPADCYACHKQRYYDTHSHHGDPADPFNPSKQPFPHDCGLCHTTIAWDVGVRNMATTMARLVAQPPAGHDAVFLLSSGKHRGATCDSCHLDPRRPARVACTGCHAHDAITVRRQHGAIAAGRSASSCLRCHPGGMPR